MGENFSGLRIVIVAEHASAQWGGEAILPIHYFRYLRERGIDAWLVVHARTQPEVEELFPYDIDRLHFIAETRLMRWLYHFGYNYLPRSITYFTTELVMRIINQRAARSIVRKLVAEHNVHIVHQPIPVSPKEASLMHTVGAPVVIGPMNGGMNYPPAFSYLQSRGVKAFFTVGRMASNLINRLMPGKLRAHTLLVANKRSADALPAGIKGRVIHLVENGVDLKTWVTFGHRQKSPGEPLIFLFAGRLVEWKGVDLLIEAFARRKESSLAQLHIVGQGDWIADLQKLAEKLGVQDRIFFRGWLSQADCARVFREADAFILPSLYECGGAVVLEAMACALPVIATNWGGPADYLDDRCGILVDPSSREGFIDGLASAMDKLAADPVLRAKLGDAGRKKVIEEFDWERKTDRIIEIYEEIARPNTPAKRVPPVEVSVGEFVRNKRPVAAQSAS